MNEQAISKVLNESAEQGIPDTLELWPTIKARVERKRNPNLGSRTRLITRLAWGLVGLALIIAVALALSPDLRTAAAQGLQRILVGVTSQPRGFVNVTPTPPFAVEQPGNLPQDFRLTASVYFPGTGVAVKGEAERLPDLPEGAGPVAQQALKRGWGNAAHLVLVYEAPGGRYLIIAERQAHPIESLPAGEKRAVSNLNASLQRIDQGLALTWIDEGTWVAVETNLPEEDLMRLAGTFVTTQAASDRNVETSESTPNLPSRRSLPFCNPGEQPPSGLLLGEVSGQSRKGVVRIELFDRSRYSENVTYGTNGRDRREVLEEALAALQDSSIPLQKLPYGSIGTFLVKDGEDCMRYSPQVQGYIVVEMWDRQVNIGYGGTGAEMKERAIKALEQQLQDMQKK